MSGKKGQMGTKPVDTQPRFVEGFLDTMDGRNAKVRELRGKLRALVGDLGGQAALSFMELSLCERAVHMLSEIEKLEEILMVGGRKVDMNVWINMVCCYSGLLSKVQPGLKRRAKVVGTLASYLELHKESNGDE